MTYLLDADWVISFLNGRVEAVQLVKSLADEDLAISIITWGESTRDYSAVLLQSVTSRI
jgi:hypothetical protein